MRILHTSDLHIGLKLCEYPMNEEIRHILSEIVDIARARECDAVIVAGDIYDRSNPTAESMAIFGGFITALKEAGIQVLVISGNHDSAERVAYLSPLLADGGVHISPVFDGEVKRITLCDGFGNVDFYLLPFFRPSVLHSVCPDFDGDSYSDALRFVIASVELDSTARSVMTAHHFVSDGDFGDSEAGGIGRVPAEVFGKFDYTALGHLHTAHPAGENIEYSGSPVKCSFAEAGDEKSVTLVTLGADGVDSIERLPLHPLRDLRELRGTYSYVTSLECRESAPCDDFLRIVLTDEEDIPDAVAKLRVIYPKLMRLAYDNSRTREVRELDFAVETDHDALTPEEVFAQLYELQNNTPAAEETMSTVRRLFAETARESDE